MTLDRGAFDTVVLWCCGLGLGGVVLAALARGLSRCPARVRAAAKRLGEPTVFVLGGFMAFATLEGSVTRAYKMRVSATLNAEDQEGRSRGEDMGVLDRIDAADTPNTSNPVNPVNPVKESPSLPSSNNSALSDSDLPLSSVTNPCFYGIEKGTDTVTLELAWPDGLSLPGGCLDVFGNWRLAPDGWTRLAQVNVSGVQSPVAVEIDVGSFSTNAMARMAFFRLATQADTDGDGLSDAYEAWTLGTDPANPDTDCDGLPDGAELSLGTDPLCADTDGDGLNDGDEVGSIQMADGFVWHDTSAFSPTYNTGYWQESMGSGISSWWCQATSRPIRSQHVVAELPLTSLMAFETGYISFSAAGDGNAWIFPPGPTPLDRSVWNTGSILVAAYWNSSYLCKGDTNSYIRAGMVGDGSYVVEFHDVRKAPYSPIGMTYQVAVPSGTGNVIRVSYLASDYWMDGEGAVVGVQNKRVVTANGYYNLTWDFAERGPILPRTTVEYHLGLCTDPLRADMDGDGLSDGLEVNVYGTSPTSADTDGDGLSDSYEVERGLDPKSADSDGDGLKDGWEVSNGLDPKSADGNDGADADPDGDGLTNREEQQWGTDPLNADTDGDGLNDGAEISRGTDPFRVDTDCDGLPDGLEVALGTDPCQPDTDGDGMDDGWEHESGYDPAVDNATDDDPDNDADADPDGDGLTNEEECAYGTDPRNKDTDGDGTWDGAEVAQCSDPSDASDEGRPNSRVRVSLCFGDHSGSHSEKYRLTVTPAEGRGERPSPFAWVNADYGACETRTAFLKPGWRYEVRLAHAGTKPGVETDYDYTLAQSGELPPNVVLVDDDSLFGVDDTSTAFSGEGKVASVYVLKFDFRTPAGDPVKSAQSEKGIGQNEFTYDDSTSALSVLLQVEVQPALPKALGLAGEFTLPTIQGATLTWSEDSPDGSAAARTDEGFDEAAHTILAARATYQGYPTRNSGFGRKTATFTCRGMTISQDFEVFFPKSGKNHPPCTTCPNCPNWFYYWRDGAVCGINQNCLYDDTAVYGYTLPGVDRLIRLGLRAAMVNSGPESYESSLDGLGIVVVTGNGKGIRCVAETIQHEAHHLDIYDRFHGQGEDPDGDGIPTSEEGSLDGMATHPNNPNTYNLGENYQRYGDDEVRCRKIEQSLSIPMYPASDWSNPGCQHKNQYGPKVQR